MPKNAGTSSNDLWWCQRFSKTKRRAMKIESNMLSHGTSFLRRLTRLVGGDAAGLKALVDAKGNVGWDLLAESLDIFAVNALGEAESGVDNVWVKAEEVLGDLGSSWVLAIQGGDECSRFALWVELVVDAANRENSALELLEVAGDFSIVASLDKAVLQDVAEVHLAFDDGQEFGGTGMNVRGV